jgi:cytidine deaminase
MTDQELVERAFAMHPFAYAPYSHFPVGAALLCADGTIYTGCNVENAAYGSSICAERTALVKAVSEGHQGDFVTLAIAGQGEEFCYPCGVCRQMLYEFAPNLRILAANGAHTFTVCTLSDLMPHGFGANQFTKEDNTL